MSNKYKDVSELPTNVICEWLNALAKSETISNATKTVGARRAHRGFVLCAPAIVDGDILREAAKRLCNLHNAHLHHPDCAYWKWDWQHSWDDTDCTCDSLGEAQSDLECAVANAQGWKTAAEKAEYLVTLKNEHLIEVMADLRNTEKKLERAHQT